MTSLRCAIVVALCSLAAGAFPTNAARAVALGTNSVTLLWTAPGDDATTGTATRYDMRYSLAPITTANFAQATAVTGVPAPAPSGTRQQKTVTGLDPDQLYYFALKTVDEAGNWSQMATVSFRTAAEPTQPSVTYPLSLSAPYPSPARGPVRLDMSLPRDMEVRVVVMDVSGRLLRWLAAGSYPAGTTALDWDLVDDAGTRVSAGQYWVLGEFGNTRFTHRLTVVP